jgi:hypothetical protein
MNAQIVARPVKTAVLGFLGFMIVVTGNFLPKMRPLSAPGGAHGGVGAAERLAGWVLVLTGITHIALFTFATLDQARRVSSIIGVSAIACIAVSWTWSGRHLWLHRRDKSAAIPGAGPTQNEAGPTQNAKLMRALLFAFFFVFSVACVAALIDVAHWSAELKSWMGLGFIAAYSGFFAARNSKRCVSRG